MAKVLGVGGVFFKANDPAALCKWYSEHLNFELDTGYDGASFKPNDMPSGSLTVWSPFKRDTQYFEPSKNDFMFNLIVDDLKEALVQVQAGGAQLNGEPEHFDYGSFGWFSDPEGNKVELWEPKAVDG
ncbi:VOC family protein [Lentilitoribacter sp. EG35]|jgi:predicted enzyme related to lactoylglutathione lyase|uniref:VOC family protein n=1 Tax=Lentilitoribacter sp. EG35 TaxID=3234192 RepID=UPI00346034BE